MIAELTSNLNPTNDWIHIGTLVKPVGLRGEVRLYSKTDFVEERFSVGSIVYYLVQDRYQPLEIASFRLQKNQAVVAFKGLETIEAVSSLLKQELYIQQSQRHELDEDQYYFDQLLGLAVYEDQDFIGTVVEVFEQPASTMLRIKKDDTSFLLPFLKVFIKEVDLVGNKFGVHLIEGFYEN